MIKALELLYLYIILIFLLFIAMLHRAMNINGPTGLYIPVIFPGIFSFDGCE